MKFLTSILIISSVSAIDTIPVGTYDRCDLAGGYPKYWPKSCPATDCCSNISGTAQRCIPYYKLNANGNLDATTSVTVKAWHKDQAGLTSGVFSATCPDWVKGAEKLAAGAMAVGAAAYLSL